jgi:hypothetical protein
VRPAAAPGQTVVGCRFLDIDDGSVHKIDRILNGGREPESRSASLDVSSLRGLAAGAEDDDEPTSSSWLGRLKRREP